MCAHPCLCESIKTPSLCFPPSINYGWRGGLSGRVRLGQSNLSSGFKEQKAGHGAESKTHISLSQNSQPPPPAPEWTALPKARARGGTESLQAALWERRELVRP